MTDRPTTEPRTAAGRRLAEADAQALWSPAEVRAAILAIEAEAAQGAAPRAEGLEREAAAATPSLPDVRYALGLMKRIHSAAEEWTKYDENTPGDAEQAIQRIGKSVRAELGLVIEALARLDEGSATPEQTEEQKIEAALGRRIWSEDRP